jgi:hypothetical protein
MAAYRLCRGEQCPIRKQCRRFTTYLQTICDGNTKPSSISHCPDQKWFERDPKNVHPQHKH